MMGEKVKLVMMVTMMTLTMRRIRFGHIYVWCNDVVLKLFCKIHISKYMCDARMTIMIKSMTMFVNLLVTTRCTARRSLLPMSVVAKRRPLVANTCNQLPEM